MYRLTELSDSRRKTIGWTLLLLGTIGMILAVWWIHYSSFPETEIVDGVEVPVVLDQFDWVPRGKWWKALGYVVSFGSSQMMVVGALFLWVLNQKMTWARATFAAFVTWIELVILFGIVPSEWLNFAQTDLDWSNQREAFVIPPWLVLGNEVGVSLAALKDAISMGYHIVLLGAGAVFAIQLQKMKEGRPAAAAVAKTSPYGRPLVKGDR